MPNGDCPVGSANGENIKAIFRQMDKVDLRMGSQDRRMDRIEECMERMTLSTERNKWQIGLIVAGVGLIGNAIAIPIVLKYLGM